MAIMASSNPNVFVHGVLVSFDGVGVLITGESGVGKSDFALKLVLIGQKLIADDVVEIERKEGILVGRAPKRFAGLLAIRGIGIIDVRKLFGCDGFRPHHKIDFCIDFSNQKNLENTSNKENRTLEIEMLGVKIPVFAATVARKRNPFALVAAAARHNGPLLTIDEI